MTEHPPRALRWALRFHPAAYRAEHEAELTAIYVQATQDAGPLDRLREALDIAGHGVRQRTGLGSDRTAGQVLAQAAPLTVAIAMGSSLWFTIPTAQPLSSSLLGVLLVLANQGLMPLLWLAALAAVWTGRWNVARSLVVPAIVLQLADVPLLLLGHFFQATYTGVVLGLAVPLLTGAIILAAPRDLLGSSQPQRAAIACTTALAVVLWGAQLADMYYPQLLGGSGNTHTLWAGVLAIALLFSTRDRLLAGGLAVAVLPNALQMTVSLLHPLSSAGVGALLVVLLSGAVPLLRARRHRAQATPPSAA
ncbi:hypothetical protein [Streptomyces sp.]|uniref:hypothetical protein n=1 Tax=Streptomyces sp. TaxID=1931 RepID=UPI002D78D51B|nr:hypothetical protein [Streptomyces sp.]HET6357565.1 hypothetical protein [Streptomyces sp.]